MKFILLLITLLTTVNASNSLKIYIFSIGHADSQLILFPSGYSILIDAGESGKGTDESGSNGKYLAKRIKALTGKTRIDVFVLTHYHGDHHGYQHQGGIWYLIEKAGISFGKFVYRNIGSYNGSSLSNCKKSTIDWKYVGSIGDKTAKFVCYAMSMKDQTKLSKIGELAKRCNTNQIHPPDDNSEVKVLFRDAMGVKDSNGKKIYRNSMNDEHPASENDFSICLRITFNKFVYITCGDLTGYEFERSGDGYMYHDVESSVAPMVGEVDVLHINHHGSKTSTNEVWANTLKPTVAIASCGKVTFAPAKRVMKNLYNVKSQVYTTGLCYNGGGSKYYDGMIRMNDDVVITVPQDKDYYVITNSKAEKKKSYDIKQNKEAPKECQLLEKV